MITKDSLRTLKQLEIAALLGLSDRRIQQLHAEGLPRNGTGRGGVYDWAVVLPWYVDRISGSGEGGGTLNDREREQRAKADMAEMEAAKMAGTLVDAAEARMAWEDFLARLRSNLRNYPDRIVPLLDEGSTFPERLAIARREMDSTLRDIVTQETAAAQTDSDEADSE